MKNTKTFLAALLLASTASAFSTDQVDKYQQRYQLSSRNQKLVNNYGDGYENLYGVRNFRGVLRGVLYRGGANNKYNRYGSRSNSNPLPTVGLNNLCEEGFGSAVYLYSTNYSSAPKKIQCKDFNQKRSDLNYVQLSGLESKNEMAFLEMIYKAIKGQIPSPIYMHCWNGWHASGLVSSLALRQFCNVDGDAAVRYWIENTDGNSEGYASIKSRIRNFKPLPQFQISREEREALCYHN